METYGYNALYLTRNGQPWLPIMGEMQPSRSRREEWRNSLYKMKAGGVTVVQSYIIWLHHEEIENEWDFSGNKCLRAFLEEVQHCGLKIILRLGPWIHGEARNGGFPDWLLKKGWLLRCDDENYLAKVREYFGKLYEQARGYFLKDGGPIIGIQVENEYGHCRSDCNGEPTDQHMITLTRMLKEIGFDAPLYSATGWSNAFTGGLLPTWACYCDSPWEQRYTELPPNPNYIFSNVRNDINVGSDAGFKYGSKDTVEGFPFCTSELGGGIHCSEARRPVVHGSDIGAMSLCKFGSGMNLFGYYVYHGGTNPVGKLSYFNEYIGTRWSGCNSNVLELSYDFQAPIDEYGKIRDAFKEIKLYGLFVRDFGADMACLQTVIPGDNPANAEDLEHIRYAFRKDDSHGYLFVNNFQRRYPMRAHKDVQICIDGVTFPKFDLQDGEYFFWPYNMKIGRSLLKVANATPLCLLNGKTYVFYTDKEPVYEFAGEQDKNTEIITLSRADALNAYRIELDRQHLVISDSLVMQTDQGVEMLGAAMPNFKVYPDLSRVPAGFQKTGMDGFFTCYEKTATLPENKVTAEKLGPGEYRIGLAYAPECNDAILRLNYSGNKAKLYIGNTFVADNFYNGADWNISMRYLGFPEKLTLKIEELKEDTPIFVEKPLVFHMGVANELHSAQVLAEVRSVW